MRTVSPAVLFACLAIVTMAADDDTCSLSEMGPCYTELTDAIFADPSITTEKDEFCSVYSTFYHCMRDKCGGTLPPAQLSRVQQEQEQYGHYCDVSAGSHARTSLLFITVLLFRKFIL